MELRNVAIIAHVDHGKTTLVDGILKQTGVFRANADIQERVLDSDALERERGITILAKNTAVSYLGYKINIVDTPGHTDFGGEVERIMDMVDGALLVVDAFEGPMPQTRFVLQKALARRVQPIVLINKIDRPDCRPLEVVDEVLDLFIDLGADEALLDFPVLFGSARSGVVEEKLEDALEAVRKGQGSVRPLLDAIVRHIPPPAGSGEAPLQLLVSTLDYDSYIGRIAIGRLHNGTLKRGAEVAIVRGGTDALHKETITQLFVFENLKRVPAETVAVGEIAAIAGLSRVEIGDTITSLEEPRALPPLEVDQPTLMMLFRVNDSPFAGQEGKYLTSRHLRERLEREKRVNVALRVRETESPDVFEVAGRGELHLSILIENMRREGYEMAVSKPKVLLRESDEGLLEPLEHLVVDIPAEHMGVVMERLGARRGELLNMTQAGEGRLKLEFTVPTRGLIGFASDFLTETKGTGVMHYTFHGYGPYRGEIPSRNSGSLVAWEQGEATTYAIVNIQERGTLFIRPGTRVYEGMIIGEHSRERDLWVNVIKKKHVTNIRSSTADIAPKIDEPRILSLEEALAFVAEDELVEITPKSIRLRKAVLDRNRG
ncbi:MAG: translational GTPase TypA [Firmicutes bacterium]|jgi:GTP-binding protein|nr:translational GTPase TypA [Bacillota bacterium]